MRNAFFAVLLCLVAVSVNAQDLSEFDKKGPLSEVKTECFTRAFDRGEEKESKVFETTRHYGVDGEMTSKTSKSGAYLVETEYTVERDKDGRVVKRTEKETLTEGTAPPHVRPMRSWIYTYDETGAAAVVCKEVEEKKEADPNDPNPTKELLISENWKLDASGRVLKYSQSLGDQENFRVEFERDKDGKLLTKTKASGELLWNKETYTYRDDGTLKESDEMDFMMTHTKKQYDSAGREAAGQGSTKDGKTIIQWTVDRSASDGSKEVTTYNFCYEDKDKVIFTRRYVVTKKQYK